MMEPTSNGGVRWFARDMVKLANHQAHEAENIQAKLEGGIVVRKRNMASLKQHHTETANLRKQVPPHHLQDILAEYN